MAKANSISSDESSVKIRVHHLTCVVFLTLAGLAPWPVPSVHAVDPPCVDGRPSVDRVLDELREETSRELAGRDSGSESGAHELADADLSRLSDEELARLVAIELGHQRVRFTDEPPAPSVATPVAEVVGSPPRTGETSDTGLPPLAPERVRTSERPPRPVDDDFDEGSEVGVWSVAKLRALSAELGLGMDAARSRDAAPPPPPAAVSPRNRRNAGVLPAVTDEMLRRKGMNPESLEMPPPRKPRGEETVAFSTATGARINHSAAPELAAPSTSPTSSSSPGAPRVGRDGIASFGRPPVDETGRHLGTRDQERSASRSAEPEDLSDTVLADLDAMIANNHPATRPVTTPRTGEMPPRDPLPPVGSDPELTIENTSPTRSSIVSSPPSAPDAAAVVVRASVPVGVGATLQQAPGHGAMRGDVTAVHRGVLAEVRRRATAQFDLTGPTRTGAAPRPRLSAVAARMIEGLENLGRAVEAAWARRRHGGPADVAVADAMESEILDIMRNLRRGDIVSAEPMRSFANGGTRTGETTLRIRARVTRPGPDGVPRTSEVTFIFKAGEEFFRNHPDPEFNNLAVSGLVDEGAEAMDYNFSRRTGADVVPPAVESTQNGIRGSLHYVVGDVVDGMTFAARGDPELAATDTALSPFSMLYNFITGQRDNRSGNVLGFADGVIRAFMGREVLIDRGTTFGEGMGLGTLIWDAGAEWVDTFIPQRYRAAFNDGRWQDIPESIRNRHSNAVRFFYEVMSRRPESEWMAISMRPEYVSLNITADLINQWRGAIQNEFISMFADPVSGRQNYNWLMGITREQLVASATRPDGTLLISQPRIDAAWSRVLEARHRMRDLNPRPAWMRGLPMPTD